MASSIDNPTSSVQKFPFLHILSSTCVRFLIIATLTDMRRYLTVVLIYIPLDLSVWHLYVFFGKMSNLVLRSFLALIVFGFGLCVCVCVCVLSCMSPLHILIVTPYWMYHLQISSPIQ